MDSHPHDSAEGGYLAPHWDTYDLLADVVGLSLPHDSGDLFLILCEAISDQTWCEYDWLTLDLDRSLASGWGRFSDVVQHQRRFFSTISALITTTRTNVRPWSCCISSESLLSGNHSFKSFQKAPTSIVHVTLIRCRERFLPRCSDLRQPNARSSRTA